MDAFFAQVEERENPQFKGKPVVVGADPKGGKGRGVVSTCNYLARKYGLHSALPISKAFELCPNAIFLPVDMELYQKVSENIMEIIKKYSKKWEVVSLDEAYLDVSFLKNYQEAEKMAKRLKKEIFEKEKLTSTIGIGPNKLIAKIASAKAKPDGLLIVKPEKVKNFLEPLDLEDLPGIGPKTAERLRNINANNIRELKRISKAKLREIFGVVGETIYEKARGIDEDPVINEKIIKSIGKEQTFERDTRDSEIIFNAFDEIIESVWKELGGGSPSAKFRTITVVCRFQGFKTHTKSKTLQNYIDNLDTFKKEAKILLLQLLLANKKPVRLIGLRINIC